MRGRLTVLDLFCMVIEKGGLMSTTEKRIARFRSRHVRIAREIPIVLIVILLAIAFVIAFARRFF